MAQQFELKVNVKNRCNYDVNVHAVPPMGNGIIVEPGMDGETRFPTDTCLKLQVTTLPLENLGHRDDGNTGMEANDGFVVMELIPKTRTANGHSRNGFKNIEYVRCETGNDFSTTKRKGWCELIINFPYKALPFDSAGNANVEVGIRNGAGRPANDESWDLQKW